MYVTKKMFKEYNPHTALMPEKSTSCLDQMPKFHFFRKVNTMKASKFSKMFRTLLSFRNETTQFRVGLKDTEIYYFYFVDNFFMFKSLSQYCIKPSL